MQKTDIRISQGSVATLSVCGGIFRDALLQTYAECAYEIILQMSRLTYLKHLLWIMAYFLTTL